MRCDDLMLREGQPTVSVSSNDRVLLARTKGQQ